MYKKEEIIQLQKDFAKRHFPALILLIVYLLVETFNSFSIGAPAFIRTAIICVVLIVEQAFRPSDFLKNTKFIFALKMVQLFVFAVFVMHDGYKNYECAIYVLMYLCVALESGIYFDLTDKGIIFLHGLIVDIPIVVMGVVYAIKDVSITYVITSIVMLAAFDIAMSAVLEHIGKRYEKFENAVLAKERIIDKAMDNNKEIIEKQEKLYYVNEQLGLKRIELESANRKINANNLEVSFQNEMLHFFTEAFDMVKIDEFFSKQLISSMDVKCAGLLKISETEKSIYEDYKRSNPLYDTDVKYKMYGDINDDTCKLLLETFTSDAFIERLSDGYTYICNNVKHSEYSFLKNEHIFSFAARLILVDGRRAGVYVICDNEPEFFMQRDTFFDNILSELQVGMNNAFLYMQFENLAKRDGLTGLYNRRILNKFMEKYRHADDELKKERVAAAMFDIDNFKSINDTYGHLFGDAVIVAVSAIIRKISEEHGCAGYRYGGEEFVILFINKDSDEVIQVVEQIHREIREKNITLGEQSVYINTSAGVSFYPEQSTEQSSVIDNADRAMYISKTTGKGKITIDGKHRDV